MHMLSQRQGEATILRVDDGSQSLQQSIKQLISISLQILKAFDAQNVVQFSCGLSVSDVQFLKLGCYYYSHEYVGDAIDEARLVS